MPNIKLTPLLPDSVFGWHAVIELGGEYQIAVQTGLDAPAFMRIKRDGTPTAMFRLFVPVAISGVLGDLPIGPIAANGYKYGLMSADAAGYVIIRLKLRQGDTVSASTTILALEYMGDGLVT